MYNVFDDLDMNIESLNLHPL